MAGTARLASATDRKPDLSNFHPHSIAFDKGWVPMSGTKRIVSSCRLETQ
jgi:hypothetical protein